MFSSPSFHIKNGAGYTSSSLVVLSSKWKIYNGWWCSIWLLCHTTKSVSHTLLSTNLLEADLSVEEEP